MVVACNFRGRSKKVALKSRGGGLAVATGFTCKEVVPPPPLRKIKACLYELVVHYGYYLTPGRSCDVTESERNKSMERP